MRINYLELRNYRRFKQLRLQFPDGIVGVLGLNGVGKTTLIEAIAWALFGNVEEVVRTSRESVRRAGAASNENCVAVLEFQLGDSEYRIEREMGGKSLSMKAEIRAKNRVIATGDKDVRRAVEKLIGMDHKSFFTSVFARQKELNALQNVAPGERKKVVLRMLRIDAVDDVLAEVRADRKETLARVSGAEKSLQTEDGRDKDKVITERMPGLTLASETASKELAASERLEKDAASAVQGAQSRRDELSKDVDAFNSAASDLRAKKGSVVDLQKRQRSIEARLAEARKRLEKLPQLEKDDSRWKEVSDRKELLDKEKVMFERIRMVASEIASDEREETKRNEELSKSKTGLTGIAELAAKMAEVERLSNQCQTARSDKTSDIGALRNRIAEKRESIEKDRKKLMEITAAGRAGVCPTCERTLQDAYELLIGKLRDGIAEGEKAVAGHISAVAALEAELTDFGKREEALKKKRQNLDQQLIRQKQLEASIEGKESELSKLRERITKRKADLATQGQSSYSDIEHQNVLKEHVDLRKTHDEYLELRSLKAQTDGYRKELDDIEEAVKKGIIEEKQYESIVKELEPKKVLYDSTIKELDLKMEQLSKAKDAVRRLSSTRERAEGDLERSRKELAEIVRLKKAIEEDRKRADEFSLLEDVVSSFKDHLIARVAPALSDLTSRGLESMTEGKYSKVELDDNYEMRIDDQGQLYPVNRFSGGEADLANLSLRLAISRIIADRTGAVPMNLLILDEIFGSQDPNRKRSVMAALSRLSNQYRQIFLITHIEDVKDSMNYVIKVEEQEDGTSSASLVS